jgi:hypothetical protein
MGSFQAAGVCSLSVLRSWAAFTSDPSGCCVWPGCVDTVVRILVRGLVFLGGGMVQCSWLVFSRRLVLYFFSHWFFAATVPFPLKLLGMMSLSNILSTRALFESVVVRLAYLVQVKVQNLCRQPH